MFEAHGYDHAGVCGGGGGRGVAQRPMQRVADRRAVGAAAALAAPITYQAALGVAPIYHEGARGAAAYEGCRLGAGAGSAEGSAHHRVAEFVAACEGRVCGGRV